MKTFQEYENKGRDKFEAILKNNNITDYEFAKNTASYYDCKYKSNKGEDIYVEIKHRDDKYSKTPDMLIERNKYNNLHKVAKEESGDTISRILYVNTFDCRSDVKVAEITNKEFEWSENKYQKTHCGDRTDVTKSVAFIKDFKWVK